jgi:UPF0755 protein
LPHPQEYATRADRRHADRIARSHRIRNALLAAALAVVILVAIGLGGWLLYRKIHADRNPPIRAFKVLLPEGLTNRQTAEKVAASTEGKISEGEFLAAVKERNYSFDFSKDANGNLEGFLFPKTYEVTSLTSARTVVNILLKQFHIETEHLEWSHAQSLGVTPYQVIIISSLIEKEAKVSEDRPLIASVIYNRLKMKMKLGIDATVEYALGQWKPVLTDKDLQVDSPYNTYRIAGLPPAPICNPGFESIRAALYPASTNYIYYILTGADGKHSFTADYQEFKRWKDERDRRNP